MTLRLTLKAQPDTQLDCSGISFDRLHHIDPQAISALPLSVRECQHATSCQIGDWFAVDRTAEANGLMVCGATHRCAFIGTGNASGDILIEGDVGPFAAVGMRGGTLLIRGDAGNHLASELRGGHITVLGNAGDCVAGPRRGERSGMRGGSVWIQGNVGPGCGERMRRGVIVVEGDADGQLGIDMIAGSIVLKGGSGSQLGKGMRRGTLVLLGEAPECMEPRYTAPFPAYYGAMELMRRALVDLQSHQGRESAALQWPETRSWVRCMGDRAVGGQGEIVWIQ